MGYKKGADGPIVKKGGTKGMMPTMAGGGMVAMKKGGKAHSDMAKDKPMMKKVAKAAVKTHEKRMHKGKKKMADGGMVPAPPRPTPVRMRSGGSC